MQFGSWPMLPIFEWVKAEGKLSWPEMLQIFNCGIGYILILDPDDAEAALDLLDARDDVDAFRIGEIVKRKDGGEQVEMVFP